MTYAAPPKLSDLIRAAADKGFSPDAVDLVFDGGGGVLDNLYITEVRPQGEGWATLVMHDFKSVLEEADRLAIDL